MDLHQRTPETNEGESTNTTSTSTNTEDCYIHHMTDDFLHASRILRDHEVESTMRYSTYEVSAKFGETGKFHSINMTVIFLVFFTI